MTDRADLIGTPSAMAASNQVVAMFETYDHARAARDALVAAGIDRSQIELLDRSAAEDDASFRYERNEEGFWAGIKHLFMPVEDNHFYAEGINRGHAMLVVRGTASEQDQIITLLDDQHPLAGCGKTCEFGDDFRVHRLDARYGCDRGAIGMHRIGVFAPLGGIGAEFGHGYAAAPNSLGRRTRL